MMDRLYKVYAYVKSYKRLGEVCLEWVCHSRQSPVAAYHEMIDAYDDLTPRDREYACTRVDEMFTDREMPILFRHLEAVHKIEPFTVIKPLPIAVGDMEDKSVVPRDVWEPGDTLTFSGGPQDDLPFEVRAYAYLRRNPIRSDRDLLRLIRRARERIDVMAQKIFETLPGRVTGIHCYILDCGCVGLRQKFEDGSLNAEVELHHDPDRGPCAVCMAMKMPWENRIIDEVVVYNSMVRIG